MPPAAAKRRPQTPSERAAEHAQKLKEQQARRQQNCPPGPGAYDPKKPAASAASSQTAFKSQTDRSKPLASAAVPNSVGDPGAYEMSGHLSTASTAKSFSSKKGASGFGGTARRELKLTNSQPSAPGGADDAASTPAPGTYEPLVTETGRESAMHSRNGTETMKSASFASMSKRAGVAHNTATPGPGAYEPRQEAVNQRVTHAVSRTGRDARYAGDHVDGTGDDCTTGAHVGPGSYEPRRNKDGELGSMARSAEAGSGLPSASMSSETGRPIAADLW
jgi:hypothetical protein